MANKIELKDYYPALIYLTGDCYIPNNGMYDSKDPNLEKSPVTKSQAAQLLHNRKAKIATAAVYDLKAVEDFDWNTRKWKHQFKNRQPLVPFWESVINGTHPYIKPLEVPLEDYLAGLIGTTENSFQVVLPNEARPAEGIHPFTQVKLVGKGNKISCNLATSIYDNCRWIQDKYLNILHPHIFNSNTRRMEIATLAPPPFKEEYLKLCMSGNSGWNYVPITESLFEDNSEIIEKVKSHILLKGIEIKYLRKVFLSYFSDGSFQFTPDSLNNPSGPYACHKGNFHCEIMTTKPPVGQLMAQPCIYHGWAYMLYFTLDGKDVLRGNRVFFTTPEYYVQCMEKWRPDLIKDFVPWSDLMFISSDWCERNGSKNYSKGIDLQTPHQRRLSLFQWIIGPCASKCASMGTPFGGITVMNGHENKNRLDRFTRILTGFNDTTSKKVNNV